MPSYVSVLRRRLPSIGGAALSVVLLAASCGDSPTRPSGSGSTGSGVFPLNPGDHVLVGFAEPLSQCQGTGTFEGVSLFSYVTVERDGATWVVRSSTPADGDVVLRFRESGFSFATPVVSGTASGTARDLRDVSSLGVFTMAFSGQRTAGAAELTGGVYFSPAPQVLGTISGVISVAGPLGEGSCTRAVWAVRKPAAAGLSSTPVNAITAQDAASNTALEPAAFNAVPTVVHVRRGGSAPLR